MSIFPILKKRDRQPELMDQPGLDGAEHIRALAGLARVNSISATVSTLWNAIRPLAAQEPQKRLRILDVACGGGDVAIGIWLRSMRCQIPVEIAGCDISPVAIGHATVRAKAVAADVCFFEHNVLDSMPGEFDVVYSTLFLHHLDEPDAVRLLCSMRTMARRLVLISDLVRSRLGYALAWCGGRMLTRSRIVHVDGPLSVRSAFTTREAMSLAQRAGMSDAILTRHWPERYLLKWDRP